MPFFFPFGVLPVLTLDSALPLPQPFQGAAICGGSAHDSRGALHQLQQTHEYHRRGQTAQPEGSLFSVLVREDYEMIHVSVCVWQSSPPRWFTRSLLWLTDSAQILNVATNLLTELPKEIVCLTNLRDLDVAQNQLTSLLPEIGLLKTLEELKVSLRCFPRREDFEILQFRVISD